MESKYPETGAISRKKMKSNVINGSSERIGSSEIIGSGEGIWSTYEDLMKDIYALVDIQKLEEDYYGG